ncbi:relaxase/mobilization nuclease domain-containing protein, partial [Proteus mirabilis]
RAKKDSSISYSSNKKFRESSYSYHASSKPKTPRNSDEVMVKITSSGKNLKAIKSHMDYISRNGDIQLEDEQGLVYKGREEVRELRDYLRDNGVKIKKKNEVKREYRQTMNIVFSMRDKSIPEEKIKKAVKATLKKLYPDNMFVLAYHGDTDNPHCHVILKIADNNGNRVNINLHDLQEIRTHFARYLNSLSVEAKARPFKKFVNKLPSRAVEIVDFGKDFYQHKPENKMSYFVTYKAQNGKNVTIWSKTLEQGLSSSDVKRGDVVSLKVSHIEKVSLPRFINDKSGNMSNEIILNRKHWKADIVERYKGFSYKADPLIEYQRVRRLAMLNALNQQESIAKSNEKALSPKERYEQNKRKLLNERKLPFSQERSR